MSYIYIYIYIYIYTYTHTYMSTSEYGPRAEATIEARQSGGP